MYSMLEYYAEFQNALFQGRGNQVLVGNAGLKSGFW
jgi:hypothetical protein